MKHNRFTLASSLSLLLGLATVALWARSHRHIDLITYARWNRYCSVAGFNHHLWITLGHGWSNEPFTLWPESIARLTLLDPVWSTSPHGFHLPGFLTEWGNAAFYTPKYRVWSAIPPPQPVVFARIHFAWPTLIFSILPSWKCVSILKRRKTGGICRNCSYNLTANTTGICPECGTSIRT